MKNLSKIKLHNLSQAEMASKEQSILKGGTAYCVSICVDAACACSEIDGTGIYPLSNSTAENNMNSPTTEMTVSNDIKDSL